MTSIARNLECTGDKESFQRVEKATVRDDTKRQKW